MKKSIFIILIITLILLLLLFVYGIFSFNDINMNETLELKVPILTKRETTELQNGDFFNEEKVIKINLSKFQAYIIKKKIEKNSSWKKEKIDEKLEKELKSHTRENIYYQIPEINNYYWIFTNRSNAVDDKHSINDLLEDGFYYAISIGIYDLDNDILYYYEFDR